VQSSGGADGEEDKGEAGKEAGGTYEKAFDCQDNIGL
jgi:hypothetical protein